MIFFCSAKFSWINWLKTWHTSWLQLKINKSITCIFTREKNGLQYRNIQKTINGSYDIQEDDIQDVKVFFSSYRAVKLLHIISLCNSAAKCIEAEKMGISWYLSIPTSCILQTISSSQFYLLFYSYIIHRWPTLQKNAMKNCVHAAPRFAVTRPHKQCCSFYSACKKKMAVLILNGLFPISLYTLHIMHYAHTYLKLRLLF